MSRGAWGRRRTRCQCTVGRPDILVSNAGGVEQLGTYRSITDRAKETGLGSSGESPAPATSQETPNGLGVSRFAGTVTYSAWLDRRMENPITSSPTAKSMTP